MLENGKQIVRRFWEDLFDEWDPSAAGEIASPEIAFRGTLGKEVRGLGGLEEYVLDARTAFPDLRAAVDDLVAEGDKVVARLTLRGTHKGELFGVAPTGRRVAYEGVALHRMSEDKIAECWVLGDILSLMRQLGSAPKPPG